MLMKTLSWCAAMCRVLCPHSVEGPCTDVAVLSVLLSVTSELRSAGLGLDALSEITFETLFDKCLELMPCFGIRDISVLLSSHDLQVCRLN